MNKKVLDKAVVLMIAAMAGFMVSCSDESDAEKEGGILVPDISNVILSEINGSQDYIELYNAGDAQVSLKGAKIRRWRVNEGVDDKQTLWEGTTEVIAPKSYLCLRYEEGMESTAYYLKRDFSSRKNTYIWLQDALQAEVSKFTRGKKKIGWNQMHMQKCDSDTGLVYSFAWIGNRWVYGIPTPGEANGEKVGNIDQKLFPIVINEIDFENNKIELYNVSPDSTVNIVGAELRWSRLNDEGEEDNYTIWYAQTQTVIEPNQFFVVNVMNGINNGEVDLSKCKNINFHLRLRGSSGSTDFTGSRYVFDEIKRGVKGTGWAQDTLSMAISGNLARIPDGVGEWESTNTSTLGSSNGTLHTGKTTKDLEIDGY